MCGIKYFVFVTICLLFFLTKPKKLNAITKLSTILISEDFLGVHRAYTTVYNIYKNSKRCFYEIRAADSKFAGEAVCNWHLFQSRRLLLDLNCPVNLMHFSLEFKHNMYDKCRSDSGFMYHNPKPYETSVII